MAERKRPSKPTDWRKKLNAKKDTKSVVLPADFAGIKAGTTMFVATPRIVADYVGKIPIGETRTVSRLRNELARKHGADGTCPVSTAIFLRIVSEAAWDDLQDGMPETEITPFWRAVEPDSKIAKKLRCDPDWIAHKRESEQQAG